MRFWKWCDRVIPHLPKRRPDDRLHVSLAGLDRRRHRTPVACGRRRPHAVQEHLGAGFDRAVTGRDDPSRGNLHTSPYEAHSQCAASRLLSTPGGSSASRLLRHNAARGSLLASSPSRKGSRAADGSPRSSSRMTSTTGQALLSLENETRPRPHGSPAPTNEVNRDTWLSSTDPGTFCR